MEQQTVKSMTNEQLIGACVWLDREQKKSRAMMNSYNSIVSNRLNIDYYNFGFSGNCRGDLILADFFAGIDTSLFVYDCGSR